MLLSRIFIYILTLLFLINYRCEAQHEIRNAIKNKTNRKINEGKTNIQRGKQTIQDIKNQVKKPLDRTNTKINKKYQNTRRKMHQIENIIKS